MDISFIKRVIPPIVTPTNENDVIKESVQCDIVDHIIKGGVHGILALGSNGEFYGLDPEQQERSGQIVIDQAAGRVPVYFGIGSITTRECVKWAKKAEELKADAISVLHPMFIGPNDEEMYQHFKAVAEATSTASADLQQS